MRVWKQVKETGRGCGRKTGGCRKKRAMAEGTDRLGGENQRREGEGRETPGKMKGCVRETRREEKQTPGRDRDGKRWRVT